MKNFTIDGEVHTCLDIDVYMENGFAVCDIREGEFKDVRFTLSNLKMGSVDESGDSQLQYDLNTVGDFPIASIKPIADNLILFAMYQQLLKENP